MPTRAVSPPPQSSQKWSLDSNYSTADFDEFTLKTPSRILSPISSNTMNNLKLVTTPESTSLKSLPDSFDGTTNSKFTDKGATYLPIRSNGLPPSQSHPNLAPVRQGSTPTNTVRMISAEFGQGRPHPNFPISEDNTAGTGATSPQQWSSAVGKANLGKSGRVIDRLMGENDMLKRELQIAKLAVEESKQAVKMVEGRMEAMGADYEGRLHEAAINKTLLKRRERQLSELKSQMDGERQRADLAIERERGWREAMEKMEVESTHRVDVATNHAMLMEGRNTVLSSHWKEQGEMVNSTVSKLNTEITALLEDHRGDRARMDILQTLCQERDERLISLEVEKEDMAKLFEAYRQEQEAQLQDIKSRARDQELANDKALADTQNVLGELKWALGVKENVRGAK